MKTTDKIYNFAPKIFKSLIKIYLWQQQRILRMACV